MPNFLAEYVLDRGKFLSSEDLIRILFPVPGIGVPEVGAVPIITGPHPTIEGAYYFDWSAVVGVDYWEDSELWEDSEVWGD